MGKKISIFCNFSLVLMLLFVSFFAVPVEARGKTLGDLKAELEKEDND